jgi:transcriptional regulator with XRE-family HTH domain
VGRANSILGTYLTALRKETGLYRCDAAKGIGIKTSYLHMLETGRHKKIPVLRVLLDLASFYSAPFGAVFEKAWGIDSSKKLKGYTMEKTIVNETEAAKMLSLAVQTLRNWRLKYDQYKGKGPVYLKMGRSVRYKVEDLHRYIEESRIENS